MIFQKSSNPTKLSEKESKIEFGKTLRNIFARKAILFKSCLQKLEQTYVEFNFINTVE